MKVNEVMADNVNGTDGQQLPDWIELTNIGTVSVHLAGWWLSDDKSSDKDLLTSGYMIAPGGFAGFAVGGSKSTDAVTTYPTPPWGFAKSSGDFGLGAGGDNAAIVAPDGTDADRVSLGERPRSECRGGPDRSGDRSLPRRHRHLERADRDELRRRETSAPPRAAVAVTPPPTTRTSGSTRSRPTATPPATGSS